MHEEPGLVNLWMNISYSFKQKKIMKAAALFLLIALTSSTAYSGNITVEKSGKGPDVIIIAGLGGTEPWRGVIEKLSPNHTCYLISIKGLNGRNNPDFPGIQAIEKEILDYISAEKIDHPVLMGHSLGGQVALNLSVRNDSLFEKLILIDAFPFFLNIYNPAYTKELALQQADMYMKQITTLTDQQYTAMWQQNMQELISDTAYQNIVLHQILQSDRKCVIEAQTFVMTNDLRSELKSIRCPVVVLCSSYPFNKANLTADVIRQRIEGQFQNIAKCNIFINNQSRHFIMIDTPNWFMDQINSNL